MADDVEVYMSSNDWDKSYSESPKLGNDTLDNEEEW